jgi:hypothetical protein
LRGIRSIHGLLPTEYYALASGATLAKAIAQTEMEFYRAKRRTVTVRHVSDDKVVALVEIVPPGRRPGLKAAIWKREQPRGKKNRLAASYEFGVGDRLPDMPLFLEPGGCVEIPLEATYKRAFAEVPARWRDELN